MKKSKVRRLALTGERYGRLELIKEVESVIKPSGYKERYVLCKCDCGKEKVINYKHLCAGTTVSCGCVSIEKFVERSTKHGVASLEKRTKTYTVWVGIIGRCYNTNNSCYKHYGGRGISMCDRWRHSFENFLEDMGERPNGYSIDRIDVNGNYEPSNCRWATYKEQGNNKTNNHQITYNGETLTTTQWADKLGVKLGFLQNRVNRGWSVEEILTTPKGGKRDKSKYAPYGSLKGKK